MIKELLTKSKITKQDVKEFFKILGMILGVNTAWMFILPLSYTYAKNIWFIIQYGPYVTIGLIILWIIKIALTNPKKPKEKSVSHD